MIISSYPYRCYNISGFKLCFRKDKLLRVCRWVHFFSFCELSARWILHLTTTTYAINVNFESQTSSFRFSEHLVEHFGLHSQNIRLTVMACTVRRTWRIRSSATPSGDTTGCSHVGKLGNANTFLENNETQNSIYKLPAVTFMNLQMPAFLFVNCLLHL